MAATTGRYSSGNPGCINIRQCSSSTSCGRTRHALTRPQRCSLYSRLIVVGNSCNSCKKTPTVKVKGKAYLYSAFREPSTQGAQVWITQGCPCKLHHTCLYLANVRQMTPPEWQTSDSSSLLIYRPLKDERLSWPNWLTYSGRYTHISGHTYATDRAEARESTSHCASQTHASQRREPWLHSSDVWWRRHSCLHSTHVSVAKQYNLVLARVIALCGWVAYLSWLGGSVVERRTFTGLRRTCGWWVTIFMGKPSAVGQPTRPTQPFILTGSINE